MQYKISVYFKNQSFFFTFGIAFSSSLSAWRGDKGPPPYALLGEPSPVDTDKEFSSMMYKNQLFINILTRFGVN